MLTSLVGRAVLQADEIAGTELAKRDARDVRLRLHRSCVEHCEFARERGLHFGRIAVRKIDLKIRHRNDVIDRGHDVRVETCLTRGATAAVLK